MADHLRASLAIDALNMALEERHPAWGSLIHHSDRGVQGGFKRSLQHSPCWPIEATGQAPLRAFSNQAPCGAGS
jgi:putative transposase